MKESRKKERRNGKEPRVNATSAVEILRQDHQRMQSLFEDFDDKTDHALRLEIRDLLIAEIRTHKAVVEELFYPALREALQNESPIDDAQEELDDLDIHLEALESQAPEDDGFEKEWDKLLGRMAHHMEWEEQELLIPAEENDGLDLIALGLKMTELRQEILGEQPTA